MHQAKILSEYDQESKEEYYRNAIALSKPTNTKISSKNTLTTDLQRFIPTNNHEYQHKNTPIICYN